MKSNIEVMTMIEMAQFIAKKLNKPVLYLEIPPSDYMSVLQSVPYLTIREHGDFIDGYGGCLIYNNVNDMETNFNMTNCGDSDVIIVAVGIGSDGKILFDNR